MTEPNNELFPLAASAPGYLANYADKLFHRVVDEELKKFGLTVALIGPLLMLNWQGPMLQRDLVKRSAVKQPAMVALLDRLESQGLIRRVLSETDKRAAWLELTAEGKQRAEDGGGVLIAANTTGLAGFSAEETTALVSLLHRFIENMRTSLSG